MNLKQTIESDFRIEGADEATQEWLLKIPPIKAKTPEGEKVSLEVLETMVIKLCDKYKVRIQWIDFTHLNGELPWYSMPLKSTIDHTWIKTLYGLSLYELYCKAALFLYAYTRKMGG